MKTMLIILCLCVVFGSAERQAFAKESADVWQYQSNIEKIADPFADKMIQALGKSDYKSFSKCMSEAMKQQFDESAFNKLVNDLKENCGDYKGREIENIELRNNHIIVQYKGSFEKLTDPVVISVVLIKEAGKTNVGGLWFTKMQHDESAAK